FQDEFAGRIATKLMQTALSVREVVMKILDMLVYVVFYFGGAIVLAATSDWRLAAPFVVWLIAYILLLRHFVPRLAKIAEQQADAKDARHGVLETVHGQMRMFSLLNIAITAMNCLLLFSVFALGIWLWMPGIVTAGAIAVSAALVMRLQGMSHWVMWEFSALF